MRILISRFELEKGEKAKKKKKKKERENLLFCIYDPLVILFSHLNEHIFRHGFSDTINPMCACRTEIETTEHFLLRCQFYSIQRLGLFENLEKVEPNFLSLSAKNQVLIVWFSNQF